MNNPVDDMLVNLEVTFEPRSEDPINKTGYMNMRAHRKFSDGRDMTGVVPFPTQFNENYCEDYEIGIGCFYVVMDDAYYYFDAVTLEFMGIIARSYGEEVESSLDRRIFVNDTHVTAFNGKTLKLLWRRKLENCT